MSLTRQTGKLKKVKEKGFCTLHWDIFRVNVPSDSSVTKELAEYFPLIKGVKGVLRAFLEITFFDFVRRR